MRCNNCIHYDVCYQYDIIGEDDSEMCALYEQKRPHGEWEWKAPTQDTIRTPHCSYCGHMNEFLLETNFCPNCGSDNRKRGDENEIN